MARMTDLQQMLEMANVNNDSTEDFQYNPFVSQVPISPAMLAPVAAPVLQAAAPTGSRRGDVQPAPIGPSNEQIQAGIIDVPKTPEILALEQKLGRPVEPVYAQGTISRGRGGASQTLDYGPPIGYRYDNGQSQYVNFDTSGQQTSIQDRGNNLAPLLGILGAAFLGPIAFDALGLTGATAATAPLAFSPEMIASGAFNPGSIGAYGATQGALTAEQLAAAYGTSNLPNIANLTAANVNSLNPDLPPTATPGAPPPPNFGPPTFTPTPLSDLPTLPPTATPGTPPPPNVGPPTLPPTPLSDLPTLPPTATPGTPPPPNVGPPTTPLSEFPNLPPTATPGTPPPPDLGPPALPPTPVPPIPSGPPSTPGTPPPPDVGPPGTNVPTPIPSGPPSTPGTPPPPDVGPPGSNIPSTTPIDPSLLQRLKDATGLTGTQLASLLSGGVNLATSLNTSNAIGEGLKAQQAATAASQGVLKDIYGQQLGFQKPYQATGTNALNQLGQLGTGDYQQYDASGKPTTMGTGSGYLTHQFNAADLAGGLAPNYDFMLQQGQMANQRAANVGGGALSGNTLQGLQNYTQNYAGNAYQNAFQNYQTQRNNIYNNLSNMAGIGQTANTAAQAAGTSYGTNITGLNTGLANATAAAMLGQAQAAGGGANSLANSTFLAALLGQK
jgi:hypothetical protein